MRAWEGRAASAFCRDVLHHATAVVYVSSNCDSAAASVRLRPNLRARSREGLAAAAPSLRVLAAANNALDSLTGVGKLTALTALELSTNRIAALDAAELAPLTRLARLCLDANASRFCLFLF